MEAEFLPTPFERSVEQVFALTRPCMICERLHRETTLRCSICERSFQEMLRGYR